MIIKLMYFNQAREIEKQYIGILLSKMTDISKTKCFFPWPIPMTPDSLLPWTPPKATKSPAGRIANPYKKSGANVEYKLTKNSQLSYKDASLQGRRQIDIPMMLVVPKSLNSTITSNTNSTANTSSTTLTATNTPQASAIAIDIKAEQQRFQREYDEKLSKVNSLIEDLTLAIARVEKDTKRAHTSITSLALKSRPSTRKLKT